jgi:DNA-binding PadR family transcriptional regulator
MQRRPQVRPAAALQDDPGAVYRALRGLERRGLVWARWEPNPAGPARKVYTITDAGVSALRTWTDDDLEVVRKLLDSYEPLPGPFHAWTGILRLAAAGLGGCSMCRGAGC